MAEQDRSKKPPAITVRCESWEDYDWITQAATKREMSRGEFVLSATLQRRTGRLPESRASKRAAAARSGGVKTSAEAKAGVVPITKGSR
jgi:uncharacterized protein (DUF1778 family)